MRRVTIPFLLMLLGCGSSSSSSDSGGNAAARQACLDTADAFARAAKRCGLDAQMYYDAFINSAANGDCANVVQIRDEAELRNVCLPSVEAQPCSDVTVGKVDPSCKSQLLRASYASPANTEQRGWELVGSEQ